VSSTSRTMGGREYYATTVAVLVLQGPGRHHYRQLIRLHLACVDIVYPLALACYVIRVADSR
jgi:hypothetical protein